MSGHSKWNNIKRKKEKTDAQKGKIFTKIGREMAVAVREGGPDPMNNGKLRDLIAKAKANNVPNDNIDRIIKKAAGDGDKNTYVDMVYEGYGPCGVAVIVEALTDNKNRTAGDLRHYFDKCGGNLGQTGCVSFMFSEKGVIVIDNEDEKYTEDQVMEDCMEAGAEDFEFGDGVIEVSATNDPNEFMRFVKRWKQRATPLWKQTSRRYLPPTLKSTTRSWQKRCRSCSTCWRTTTTCRKFTTTGNPTKNNDKQKSTSPPFWERGGFFILAMGQYLFTGCRNHPPASRCRFSLSLLTTIF